MGLVAPWHVESSWIRAWTHVPCIGRRILNHCATREAQRFAGLLLASWLLFSCNQKTRVRGEKKEMPPCSLPSTFPPGSSQNPIKLYSEVEWEWEVFNKRLFCLNNDSGLFGSWERQAEWPTPGPLKRVYAYPLFVLGLYLFWFFPATSTLLWIANKLSS